jgi:hypothetical protein
VVVTERSEEQKRVGPALGAVRAARRGPRAARALRVWGEPRLRAAARQAGEPVAGAWRGTLPGARFTERSSDPSASFAEGALRRLQTVKRAVEPGGRVLLDHPVAG